LDPLNLSGGNVHNWVKSSRRLFIGGWIVHICD